MVNGMMVLGLVAENVDRLRAGQPIFKDLSNLGGHDRILIMYGDTLDDITRELETVTGQKLPPMMPMPEPGRKPS